MSKITKSSEDAQSALDQSIANRRKRFQEFWDSLPVYPDSYNNPFMGNVDAEVSRSAPQMPLFKPGMSITEVGLYVDEAGYIWHIDPFESDIKLIVADDDD